MTIVGMTGSQIKEALEQQASEQEAARRAARPTPLPNDLAHQHQVGGAHYTRLTVQPWDAMAAWMTPAELKGYMRGNVIKYIARYQNKGGVEDLKKLRHYADKLIELEQLESA